MCSQLLFIQMYLTNKVYLLYCSTYFVYQNI
nr:MAG TPA: hypothetical protein [Caudoviricetes sp.]